MAKKKVHRFGEVCRLLDIQPYVLRYWETEFPALSGGEENVTQRTYTEEDLAVVQRIKELLYNESFTLVGAKKKLQAELDEGQLKLSTAGADSDELEEDDHAAAEAAPDESAEDAGEEEPEPVKEAKKRSVSKKTGSKKKATKKKATKRKAKASAEEPADDRSSVDLAELEAILGDARDLLEVLRG